MRPCRLAVALAHYATQPFAVRNLPQRRPLADGLPERPEIFDHFDTLARSGEDPVGGRILDLADFGESPEHLGTGGEHFVAVQGATQEQIAILIQTAAELNGLPE